MQPEPYVKVMHMQAICKGVVMKKDKEMCYLKYL